MSSDEAVFDLGEVDPEYRRPRRDVTSSVGHESRRRERSDRAGGGAGWVGLVEAGAVGIALLVPGAGHVLRARFATGLFFLASIGFLGTLSWALLGTLDRLGPTLALLGLPSAGGVWALGIAFLLAATLHVASVVGSVQDWSSPGPVIAGVASGLVPGWGQALSGRRWSAALFLTGCWVVVVAWVLVSPPVRGLLETQGLALPRALVLLSSPVARWSLPAVIWTLAVYDAAVKAARHG
jgi:hypothetical protein